MLNNGCERFVKQRVAAAALLMLSTVPLSYAGQQVIVFYLDAQYRPVARLDRLGQMSEGINAILAMYALQSGGGCTENDDAGLMCELTKSLGLDAQCSEKHLQLVRSWFKNDVPAMSIYPAATIKRSFKSGELEPICYNTPYTATVQAKWEIIKVKTEDNLVFVDAIRRWTFNSADGPFYRMRYKTEYRINPNTIAVIAHKEIPLPEKP
jgi:hypothetical protein